MTFGSLFSGIGGMDLGLEWAGMECRWQVEVDPFCSRILAKHWPRVMRHGDIHTFTNAEHVDLIAGGFPCQPVYLSRGQRIYLTRRLRTVEARLRDAAAESWAPLDLVDATRREVATIRGILKQLREARTDG